jgi:hypothetical protein
LARDNAIKDEVWREEEIEGMREMLFDLICDLHGKYEKIQAPLLKAKAQAKHKLRAQPSGSTGPSASEKTESPERLVTSPGNQIMNEANGMDVALHPETAEAAVEKVIEPTDVDNEKKPVKEPSKDHEVDEDEDEELLGTVVLKQPTPPAKRVVPPRPLPPQEEEGLASYWGATPRRKPVDV